VEFYILEKSLNKEVFNQKTFLSICPLSDDIWFKSMGLLNNTSYRRVFNKNIFFPTINGTQVKNLTMENVDLKKNDIQLKKVFDKYNLYKKIK